MGSNKASSNIKKHGVSFDEAQSVFFDRYARLIPDPDSSFGEERFIILGQSDNFKTLIVCHCYQNLINLYLKDYASSHKELKLNWQ